MLFSHTTTFMGMPPLAQITPYPTLLRDPPFFWHLPPKAPQPPNLDYIRGPEKVAVNSALTLINKAEISVLYRKIRTALNLKTLFSLAAGDSGSESSSKPGHPNTTHFQAVAKGRVDKPFGHVCPLFLTRDFGLHLFALNNNFDPTWPTCYRDLH